MEPTLAGQTAGGLDREIAKAIAGQVVALVREELGLRPAADEWIDAKEVARRFGLSRAWVYAHARALGAVRIGAGPRPRLRFDPRLVAEALQASGGQTDEGWSTDAAASVPIHVPRVRSRQPRSQSKER